MFPERMLNHRGSGAKENSLAQSEAVSLEGHLRKLLSPWGVPSGLILPKQRKSPPAIFVNLFYKIKSSAFNSPLLI